MSLSQQIESALATVRLRHRRTKGNGSRAACLAMVFKLCESASRTWRALNGDKLLPEVIGRVQFIHGENPEERRPITLPSTTFEAIPKRQKHRLQTGATGVLG